MLLHHHPRSAAKQGVSWCVMRTLSQYRLVYSSLNDIVMPWWLAFRQKLISSTDRNYSLLAAHFIRFMFIPNTPPLPSGHIIQDLDLDAIAWEGVRKNETSYTIPPCWTRFLMVLRYCSDVNHSPTICKTCSNQPPLSTLHLSLVVRNWE